MILTLRTDKTEAEIGLFMASGEQVAYVAWQAHRELSETVLARITTLLDENNLKLDQLTGIIFFTGPGSFTGLRIGASVANALVASLSIEIIGTGGDSWLQQGLDSLSAGRGQKAVAINYGSEPHVTAPRK